MGFDAFLTPLMLFSSTQAARLPLLHPVTSPYPLRHIRVTPSATNFPCSPLLLYYSCDCASLPVNRDPFEFWNHILLIFLSPEPGPVTGTPEMLSKCLLD